MKMENKIRLSIDEDGFKSLIKGEILKIDRDGTVVLLILRDIGYDKMIEIIEEEKSKMIENERS